MGGVLETAILGLPAGVGEPYFDSVESKLAHLAFSIPAVKGIEFGSGFGFADQKGSEANDAFRMQGERIVTATNHNAGLNGGISNGMPVVFRTAVKPTPSIYKTQDTVDYIAKKDAELSIQGRHDPCIVPRAAIVQTCAAALAVGDLLTAKYGMAWMEDPHRLPQGGAVNGIRTHRRAAGPLLLQGHPRDALRLPVRPVPLPTEEEVRAFMTRRQFRAINVTIPYKLVVMEYCSYIDPHAKAINAVNTIVNRNGLLYGYNTDYPGFSYLCDAHGVEFKDRTVLILGTGGTTTPHGPWPMTEA